MIASIRPKESFQQPGWEVTVVSSEGSTFLCWIFDINDAGRLASYIDEAIQMGFVEEDMPKLSKLFRHASCTRAHNIR